jgi:hypothetical protein
LKLKTFKEFLGELEFAEARTNNATLPKLIELFEHQVYKPISGTRDRYREDSANTNTHTLLHSHVYAGNTKKQLYAVNVDGSGHDGSSKKQISAAHAKFFRKNGYSIRPDNILEVLDVADLIFGKHKVLIMASE